MKGIRHVPGSLAGVFSAVLPVAAAIYGIAFLGERPTLAHGFALACVIAGIGLASLKAKRVPPVAVLNRERTRATAREPRPGTLVAVPRRQAASAPRAPPVKRRFATLPAAPQQSRPTLYNSAPDASFSGLSRPCTAPSAPGLRFARRPFQRLAAPGQRPARRVRAFGPCSVTCVSSDTCLCPLRDPTPPVSAARCVRCPPSSS